MTIIDFICEDVSYTCLFYLIGIASISHYIVTSIIENKDVKSTNRKVNDVKRWMLIIHLIFHIICIILILKIELIFRFILILCIPLYISILSTLLIEILKNVRKIRKEEFNELEINSFLLFSYFTLLIFNKDMQNILKNSLIALGDTHHTIFECLALSLLVLKVFFISFFALYGTLMIIKNIIIVLNKISIKLNLRFKLLKYIEKFFINDDWYFYDFMLLNKYKKIKFLIPLLFIADLIILIICDIFIFLMYFIRYPILSIIIIVKYVYKFLNSIRNLNIAYFTFKWFRIMIIFSIIVTYIILKMFNINISQNIMDIFELISTVILIPLILEQIFNIREKVNMNL